MPIWDHTGVTAADITINSDGSIQISSSDPSVSTKINAIRITAWYEWFEQSVMLDRIMWRSEVVQWRWENSFIVPPPTPTGVWTAPTCPSACGASASNPAYSCQWWNGSCATNSPATLSCSAIPAADCAWTCGGSAIDYNWAAAWCGGAPINGWWSGFGACGGACGVNAGTQSRACNSPAPANGWAACVWSPTQSCTASLCPVNGWWSGFGACGGACGVNAGTQSRACNSPAPANGWAACVWSPTQSCTASLCPVNCSYTTYQWWTCSAGSCWNYGIYYTKTVVESNGWTCPISQGQFASWWGGICNTQSVPSGNQAIACSSVAGSYGIPSNATSGTAFYRVETASCRGDNWQVIWTNISGCSAPQIYWSCGSSNRSCNSWYVSSYTYNVWSCYSWWFCNGSNGWSNAYCTWTEPYPCSAF